MNGAFGQPIGERRKRPRTPDEIEILNEPFRPLKAGLICAIAVALAWAIGAFFPPGPWYANLAQPAGTPPNIVFPIAWTLLYIAMAIAAWRVWRAAGLGGAMGLYALQLILNALWMPVAFGAHALFVALLVIVALWLVLAATLLVSWRADRLAGLLMAPYLVWVSYAVYLNAGLIWLN